MDKQLPEGVQTLPEVALWETVFSVAPLVLVGTREEDGAYDLAPKHLAFPMSWEGHFGFVCTPRHGTYQNCQREGVFTVSYPRASQVVLASLTASPRCGIDSGAETAKPIVAAVPTFPAQQIDGELVSGAYLFLECEVDRIIDGFGDNSLICGRIVAAHACERAIRHVDVDDQDVIADAPLLVYVSPGRYARVETTNAFPFPKDMAH
jgi:flavin reductase (DIM6/NTAB) family NADH-FMN oxidoreductase RutF